MTQAWNDPALLNDWHPVAAVDAVSSDKPLAIHLLDHDLVLWRSSDGVLHAWDDRCPHRGTRFSIGELADDTLSCAYHGWRFDSSGHCAHIPAQPQGPIPALAKAIVRHVCVRYGLIWVCLGEPVFDVLPFPEYDDPQLRKVLCGPYIVETSGPRIVENFLDMAHFGYVHEGILGDRQHTEVRDYSVKSIEYETGGHGLLATGCFAWQAKTNSLAHQGSDVEYTYRVVRPLTAILTKVPEAQQGFREAISLHVQPLHEECSQVWIILAMTNFEQDDDELRAFQDRIFLQDKPILENQYPKRLPLQGELPIRCDQMSTMYRRYLRGLGMHYGIERATA